MAQLGLIDVINDYSADIESKLDAQRTVNMYIRSTPEGKTKASLAPMAGTTSPMIFTGLSEVRQLIVYKGFNYAVVSNKIYRISSTGIKTEIGSIGSLSGYVGVASNNAQIIWVDGANGYVYDTNTSTFSTVTAAGFPSSPQDVAFLDGYFIVNKGNTNLFFVSGLNDGLAWDALSFEGIQSRPDTLIGVRTLHRRLFLFGRVSTEVWYDAGASDFPFARDNNLLLEYGCAAPGSIAVGHQRMLWLSGDENGLGSIMMTDGTVPSPVSIPAVDYAIQKYSSVADAKGIIYKLDGHVFYELSFTTANHTWVYDVSLNKWYEKETLNKGRSKANCHSYFNGKHYIGAYDEPVIYEMSPTVYTDSDINGTPHAIRRERVCGHFSTPYMQQIRITRFVLDIVAGVGHAGINEHEAKPDQTLYDDPTIFLSWSKDGGVWYSGGNNQTFGRIGDRTHRAIWRRIGTARDWVFKIDVMSKNKVFILGASIEYEIAGR